MSGCQGAGRGGRELLIGRRLQFSRRVLELGAEDTAVLMYLMSWKCKAGCHPNELWDGLVCDHPYELWDELCLFCFQMGLDVQFH